MADGVSRAVDASLTGVPRTPAPVSDSKRIDAIDTLRGVAILGIYAVNILTFAWPSAGMSSPTAIGDTWWNRFAYDVTNTVFFGKFMFIFAMLFGATVVFFDRKTTPTDRTPRVKDGTGLWARRQGVLFAFGLVHAVLFWYGDILAPYAVVGFFIAWWLRKLSWRWHVGLGFAMHLLGSALLVAIFVYFHSVQGPGDTERQFATELEAHRGSYVDLLLYRMLFLVGFWFIVGPIFALQIGAMMLWGISLSRAGILTAQKPAAWYAKAAMVLLPVGAVLTGGVFGALNGVFDESLAGLIWNGMVQFVGVPLGLGYVALVLFLAVRGLASPVMRALAKVGRMGLTNYLCQTLISVLIFYGWGPLGLFGKIDYPGLFGVIAGVWAFNFVFSAAWLAVFRIGPVEWLWRALTYGTLPPIFRERATRPAGDAT